MTDPTDTPATRPAQRATWHRPRVTRITATHAQLAPNPVNSEGAFGSGS